MVTPTYTVVLLQIAIMLDPRESQKAPCVRDTKVATRHIGTRPAIAITLATI